MHIRSLVTPSLIKRICQFLAMLCLLSILLTAAAPAVVTPTSTSTSNLRTLPINNGNSSITYSTSPQDVLIRTFHGGGNLGTLEFSPDISIYGDGSYILGPTLQMRWGKLDATTLQQLLHTLVDTDGLLSLSRQQFYDVPDQNATLLQLMLNGKRYEFLYGAFGTLGGTQETAEYQRLGDALTSITEALTGLTRPYTSNSMALLVHQDFSPDLTQTIPNWTLPDFTLFQAATYECGPIPPDETGPNADTGCLTFTTPHYALLLTSAQLQTITKLLNGQQQGEFFERGLYYRVAIRALLPDELPQKLLAMLGSQQLSYTGVPLHSGPVPTPVPTP